jgi:hypothetical protein
MNWDTIFNLAADLAEHSHIAAGVPQARDDESAERTGAASDQDGRRHGSSSPHAGS